MRSCKAGGRCEPHLDEIQVDLVFTDTPPAQQVWNGAITHGRLVIPRSAADYKVEADLTFTRDVKLWNVLPHSHLRGVRWKYEAVHPDGRRETIPSVPAHDFNWQIDYVFDEPLPLPAGTSTGC